MSTPRSRHGLWLTAAMLLLTGFLAGCGSSGGSSSSSSGSGSSSGSNGSNDGTVSGTVDAGASAAVAACGTADDVSIDESASAGTTVPAEDQESVDAVLEAQTVAFDTISANTMEDSMADVSAAATRISRSLRSCLEPVAPATVSIDQERNIDADTGNDIHVVGTKTQSLVPVNMSTVNYDTTLAATITVIGDGVSETNTSDDDSVVYTLAPGGTLTAANHMATVAHLTNFQTS